ncbi:MAG: ATP-binding protein [Trueperaceae bacterium]
MSDEPASSGIVDRKEELRELRHLLDPGEPRLALLTGRRRIGKTFLLANAWSSRGAFLFTAARTSPELNRRQLLTDLANWSGEPLDVEDYPTWRSVFNLLLETRAPEPTVLVIDEFQYLANDETGLAEVASELNAAWERRRAKRPLLLVLSGSAVTTMEALAGGGAPLYGRFHWQHRLEPFNYWNTAQMTPFPSLRDRAQTYGVFGGTPRFLAVVDVEQAFAENVVRLMLSPRGEVRQLVETALDQEEGLRDVSSYKAIMRSVAAGQTLRNEIAQRAGLTNDSGLRAKLDRLVELGYLEARRNVDAKANEPFRYRIADPAFRFHQRFVEPNLSLLERVDPHEVWSSAVEAKLPLFMGLEFERIAVQAYDRLRGTKGLPIVKEWGRWEGRDRAGRSLEVDLVAPLVGGGMLTGAVKWGQEPVSIGLHYEHLEMLERAAHAGRGWAHEALSGKSVLYYLAAGGFEDGFEGQARRSGQRVICWDLEDVYRELALPTRPA